jgi:hypothetical protein
MKALEGKYRAATLKLKDAEILNENTEGFLVPETDLERTYNVQQRDIHSAVSIETAKKGKFELKLDQLGPYVGDYTRNGRELLLAGRKGHIATTDWREGKLGCELQLGETVRDAKWLHNNQMFAVAQKKYVYIYDRAGVELHCLKKHIEVTNMEFLPYHYLLATVVCLNRPLTCCNLSIQTNHFLGKRRLFEISGRLDWSNGHRNTYPPRLAHCPHSKSSQCHPSHGSSERNCYTLVTQFYNSTYQTSCAQGPCSSYGGRQRRQIYGFNWSRSQDVSMGHSNVQGSQQLLHQTTSIICRDLR